jgi:hypothetical protein
LLRFQRSVEIFWKLLKDYLCANEGFVSESLKACIKMAFKVRLVDEVFRRVVERVELDFPESPAEK